jgi:hypothetical protein
MPARPFLPARLIVVARRGPYFPAFRVSNAAVTAREPIAWTGTPATTARAGTTEPAPIVAPSPMVTPHKIVALDPIEAPQPTRVASTFQSVGSLRLAVFRRRAQMLVIGEYHAVTDKDFIFDGDIFANEGVGRGVPTRSSRSFPHVGVAGGDPDAHACSDRDHRRSRTCSTRARASASTPASTMTRRSLPTTITMRPLAGAAATVGAVSAATTIAGTKPACCASGPFDSGRNDRRHVISNERDMPCRLAVDDIARGACKLSMTIRSFSSSDQRRRRPVSTTSSRST